MPNRSERWKNYGPRFHLDIINGEANPGLVQALEAHPEARDQAVTPFTYLGACRELILHLIAEDEFEVESIGFTLDAATTELVLRRAWRATRLTRDDVKVQLANATAFDVPIYPENDAAAEHLSDIYADLLANGVEVEDEGKNQRLVWGRGEAIEFDATGDAALSPTESFFPADALVVTRELGRRHALVSEAFRTLALLKSAIRHLGGLLAMPHRDEAALQRCLTTHPVLFGLDYKAVIPKFRLGKSFELDFALQRHSGLVDLLEIEPSSLPLYTKSGNPSQHLVHAEQQVLDWIEWLESNSRLARDDLPGMARPAGQVCIGSRISMQQADHVRLHRRNAMWGGSITILTYEDLLDRGRNVLEILTSNQEAKNDE